MAQTYEELKAKTIEQLREIAKGIDNEAVKGYSQMNKNHLLPALCAALGIEKRGVIVIGVLDYDETLRVVPGGKKPPAVREWDDAIRIACDHQQRHMDSADEFAAGEPIAQQPLHRQERIVNLANFGERSKRRS